MVNIVTINLRARKTDMGKNIFGDRWKLGTKVYKNAFKNHIGVITARKFIKLLKRVTYHHSKPNFSTLIIRY